MKNLMYQFQQNGCKQFVSTLTAQIRSAAAACARKNSYSKYQLFDMSITPAHSRIRDAKLAIKVCFVVAIAPWQRMYSGASRTAYYATSLLQAAQRNTANIPSDGVHMLQVQKISSWIEYQLRKYV